MEFDIGLCSPQRHIHSASGLFLLPAPFVSLPPSLQSCPELSRVVLCCAVCDALYAVDFCVRQRKVPRRESYLEGIYENNNALLPPPAAGRELTLRCKRKGAWRSRTPGAMIGVMRRAQNRFRVWSSRVHLSQVVCVCWQLPVPTRLLFCFPS